MEAAPKVTERGGSAATVTKVGNPTSLSRMPKYGWLAIKGSSGIVLDRENVTFWVYDEKDRVVGTVTLGATGVTLSGPRGKNSKTVSWDDLNE